MILHHVDDCAQCGLNWCYLPAVTARDQTELRKQVAAATIGAPLSQLGCANVSLRDWVWASAKVGAQEVFAVEYLGIVTHRVDACSRCARDWCDDGDRHAITVESFASLRLRSDFLARGAPLSNLSCDALQPSWISAKLADGTVYALEFTTRDQHAPIRREPEVWPSPLKRRRLESK